MTNDFIATAEFELCGNGKYLNRILTQIFAACGKGCEC